MNMSINHNHISRKAIRAIEYGGLFIIAVCTLIAAGQDLIEIIDAGRVRLADLLLLFLYLEVIAMVSAYLESGKLPVRMPIYIGIVALARYLALDSEEMQTWKIITVASAILLLALAVLTIRYGQIKFPYSRKSPTQEDELID